MSQSFLISVDADSAKGKLITKIYGFDCALFGKLKERTPLYVHLSLRLSVYLSVCLSFCLAVYSSVHMLIMCTYLYMSVYFKETLLKMEANNMQTDSQKLGQSYRQKIDIQVADIGTYGQRNIETVGGAQITYPQLNLNSCLVSG